MACLAMVAAMLCGCDASLERSVEGSWLSGEGYTFTFDGKYLTVTDEKGDDMLETELEYIAEKGIITVFIGEYHIDIFYYTVYADTLRLEYTEPVLKYLGEETYSEFADKIMILEKIEK